MALPQLRDPDLPFETRVAIASVVASTAGVRQIIHNELPALPDLKPRFAELDAFYKALCADLGATPAKLLPRPRAKRSAA